MSAVGPFPERLAVAAQRPPGPGRTVWLASFPKSGNTWMRAILTALSTHRHLFEVNHLGSGSQPHAVGSALSQFGLDPRWLDASEIGRVRHALLEATEGRNVNSELPIVRKTHEMYRPGVGGAEPFPTSVTRAAILVVRDPRDVACSYGPFFGLSAPEAIDQMTLDRSFSKASSVHATSAQPWGSWATHTRSWLADDVPFPVHLVRYEDLSADAVGTLRPVFAAIGLLCTSDELSAAVEQCRFDRLRNSEEKKGFRETSPRTSVFFRKGKAGTWTDELSAEQVATVEAHCRGEMERLGYLPTTTELRIGELPGHLGLVVRVGAVPEQLEGATRAHRQVWVTEKAALVRFGPRRRMLVEDGRRLTIDWPREDGDLTTHDVSWVPQGWGVVMAVLQRGNLVLHASTVIVNGTTVALAGDPGAGKSTTSLGLAARGHRLLVDDSTLLRVTDGAAHVTPYCRNLHILPDTAEMFGIDFASLDLLSGNRRKAIFTPEEPPTEPVGLARVVVLEIDDTVDSPTCDELVGSAKMMALRAHVSRSGLARAILGPEREFALVSQLASAVAVHRIRRPSLPMSLDGVCDAVEELSRRQ